MTPIQALILAAGMSSRFGTELNKLVTPLCGRPLVMHSITLLEQKNIPITVIVGHQKELVMQTINDLATSSITYAVQEKQNGTGHAVMCSQKHWHADNILIINGDMPLISRDIIESLCTKHIDTHATISFVTAIPDTLNHAYGRVINDEDGIRIVEAKDFAGDRTYAYPINAGIYMFSRAFLEDAINTLTSDNASHELYLTDLIAHASKLQCTVNTLEVPFDYVRGINTREEWCIAQETKRKNILLHWMRQGVRFDMPDTIHIDDTVTIGKNVYIHAGVHLLGDTIIGDNCIIEPYSIIENSVLNNDALVRSYTHISNSILESYTAVGPFARIRIHTHIESHAEIGNFVEVKQSRIGTHTKAKHLSYLGDTTTGSCVNIGAGTITCNYDGINKHKTTIHDNAFIGSNNTLIAPVTIGQSAYTAAGSTITEDVPSQALAIGRTRQINKDNYAAKLRKKDIKKVIAHNDGDQSII